LHIAIELESDELVRMLLDTKNYELLPDMSIRDKKKNVISDGNVSRNLNSLLNNRLFVFGQIFPIFDFFIDSS
jgi:hypothetical protein